MSAPCIACSWSALLASPVGVGVPTGQCLRRMEENFEYYFRVYTLCFQLGLKLAMQCTGLQHIIGVSAPGCNLSQSPRLSCECTPPCCVLIAHLPPAALL